MAGFGCPPRPLPLRRPIGPSGIAHHLGSIVDFSGQAGTASHKRRFFAPGLKPNTISTRSDDDSCRPEPSVPLVRRLATSVEGPQLGAPDSTEASRGEKTPHQVGALIESGVHEFGG